MLPRMARILELRCEAHGEYEHHEKVCPWGCPPDWVTQEFRTAPNIRHGRTRFVDHQLRGLAQDYGLSDIKNDKDGSSVMQSIRKGEDFSPKFVDIPHAAPGWTQRGEKPMQANAGSFLMGQKGENAIDRYTKTIAPQIGYLEGPKPFFVNRPNPDPGAFS